MDRGRKRELRELNARTWAGEGDVLVVNSSLDSAWKKNTAFIKRLRASATQSSTATTLQEIRSLSLHKYLSEIISATLEGLSKLKTPAEVAYGAEIVSALHQRFGPTEFTSYLGWLLGRGLSTPEKSQLKSLPQEARDKEEKERLMRQKILLKVVTELWLVGVLRSLDDVARPDDGGVKDKDTSTLGKSGEKSGKKKTDAQTAKAGETDPFPLEVLKDLLGHDREHINLPMLAPFVKSFSWDLLGTGPSVKKDQQVVGPDGVPEAAPGTEESSSSDESGAEAADDPPFSSIELQQRFRNVFERYLEDVKLHLKKNQKQIASQSRKNAEAYIKSGEVFEDRQANFEKQVKAQEKLATNAQILCDVLGSEMPDLKDEETTETSTAAIGMVNTGEYLRSGEGSGIWEDEDERRFYENLIDLKDRVPPILLEEPKKKVEPNEPVGKKASDAPGDAKDKQEKPNTTETSDDQPGVNKNVGAQVESLLSRLSELQTKDAVDQAAVDFAFLNSKASRNRLIKAVQEPPKGRSDLLPMYSRLIATLGKYLADIPASLVQHLDDEFRSLQRRKSKDFLGQIRTSNIRYLAELTKFGIVPNHVIFHCLKVSLDDFSRMNIEIIANLLENCGRYLLRSPETSARMRSFLETLKRKKTAHHLGQQERMLIENAMFYVDPPERAAIQQKERTPIEMYIRRLIYLDMNKRTYAKVLKSIRKLHWEESEIVELLEKVFSKPAKVKYSNIHLLAILVGALYRYHQDFVVDILDNVMENITLGLEQNAFKMNQKRIADVKYLGELYNYKMVDSPVIFDTMYRILTFGHEKGVPSAGSLNPLDLPDDFFRIRLICNVLDTCGNCFDRGVAKNKLDFFLSFFQYYIRIKDPMPMDIEFIVQDTFAACRPQWKIAPDLDEAGRLFADAVSQNYKNGDVEKAVEVEEAEEDSLSDDGDADELPLPPAEEQAESSDDTENEHNDDAKHDSDFEEDIVVTKPEEERDPEAEAEFDRELAKMMSEGADARKFERKPIFDVPLPLRKARKEAAPNTEENLTNGAPVLASKMAFSLMTKRGNKQQTRTVELPSDSTFAVAMKSQREAERAEQQRIKSLVLNYDMQEMGDPDGTSADFSPPIPENPNLRRLLGRSEQNIPLRKDKAYTDSTEGLAADAGTKRPTNASIPPFPAEHAKSVERPSGSQRGHRARKLQLSDVDWYGSSPSADQSPQPSDTPRAHDGRRGGRGRSAPRGRRR